MKTPPVTPVTPSHPDWLNDCSFQSRQDSPGLMPGILSHHVKKPANPDNRNSSPATGVTDLSGRGLAPHVNAFDHGWPALNQRSPDPHLFAARSKTPTSAELPWVLL